MSGGRLLLIGLDSADAELIEAWMADGTLPVLAGLVKDGRWLRLRTTAEVMHVSAWPTIYTGTHPGRHGLYHAFQVRAGLQRIHRAEPAWRAVPAFWELLDRAGRRVMVVDAFMDRPLGLDFSGIQVCEYGTWTWFSEPGSRPEGLYREIVRRFGRYPAPEHTDQVTIPDQLRFRDTLVRAAAVKGQVLAWLLAQYPWDVAFVNFAEPHGGGHYLWHSGDPDYPLRPRPPLPEGAHPLRDVYAAVDRAIGRVLEAVGEDVTVMVFSGDGMGPNYSGSHLMPPLLRELGLLYDARAKGEAASAPKAGLAQRLRQLIPLSVRQSISRCLPRRVRREMAIKWMNSGIDWSRTRVFCIPNSNEGYFRVNLAGREPEGIVDGDEYARILADLGAELAQLVNPANGCRCAHGVFRTDDVFPGSERPHLPDLVISFDPAARILDRVAGPRAGTITGPAPFDVPAHYTGNHRPNAFLALRGPRLRREVPVESPHIADIAATVLAAMDVPLPGHMDGRPLPLVD